MMCKSWRISHKTNENYQMNKNVVRIGLAAIAAFYVVVGGLWASHYLPLKKFENQIELQRELVNKLGFDAGYESKEYKEAEEYKMHYALTSPDLHVTYSRMALYQSLLLWGTVALAVGGGVLFLTRGRRPQPAQTGVQ